MPITATAAISEVTIQRLKGESHTVGTPTVTVLAVDVANNVTRASGTTVPTDADAGFAVGAIFIKTNGAAGTTIYTNEGTATSSDFNAVESAGTAGAIRYASVNLTNAQMLALRATPIQMVAAPGAGNVIEFCSAELFFDYTAAYTEADDNLAFRLTGTSGTIVSQAIEATGFVDATADTKTNGLAKIDVISAKTACDNQALFLHNTGGDEYGGGNAANVVRVKVAYRIHAAGW